MRLVEQVRLQNPSPLFYIVADCVVRSLIVPGQWVAVGVSVGPITETIKIFHLQVISTSQRNDAQLLSSLQSGV